MSPDLSIWERLAVPFPDDEVKHRPGAAKWDHKPNCEGSKCRLAKDPEAHVQFSYVDARAVAQRLDEVLTPGGWQFTCAVIAGSDVVKGRLEVFAPGVEGGTVREDHGYPNSERDEEPIKAATSDALKRCAVLFGVGRHLYEDNRPTVRPARAQNGAARQPTPAPTPIRAAPARSSTDLPDGPALDWDVLDQKKPQPFAAAQAAKIEQDGSWTYPQLKERADSLSVPLKVLGDTSKRLYGPNAWKLTDLTGEQRYAVAVEVGLL
jgi:hypothetical protein